MIPRSTLEVVRLSGELDIERKQELRDSLQIRPQARAMLIDLTEVTYADSTALSELLRMGSEAESAGVPVAIVVVTPQFKRVVRYAGLEYAFKIFEARGEALLYLEQLT